jgi:hypothetical protein
MNERQAAGSDPFLDPSYGPETWARIAPTGKRYWPFVLLLAIGLSGFSFYWRNQVLPQQGLVWQTAEDVDLAQLPRQRRPILVWWQAGSTAERARSANPASASGQPEAEADSVGARLDVPALRVATRLYPTTLVQIDRAAAAGQAEALFPDGWPAEPGLLLWDPSGKASRFVPAPQVDAEGVVAWLKNVGGGSAQ